MFWSRLDDAKQDIDNSRLEIKSSSSKLCDSQERAHDVLFKVSEYLFDLFDANCLEGFKKIDEFEKRALEKFKNFDDDEYTFEQEELHKEFMALFESLLEDFLKEESITSADLISILTKNVNSRNEGNERFELSNEIAEVIEFYTTFNTWADHMKAQCSYAREHANGFSDTLHAIQKQYLDEINSANADLKMNESFTDNADSKSSHK